MNCQACQMGIRASGISRRVTGTPRFPDEWHNHQSLFGAYHLPGVMFLQPA
jgi:hypothetical protein